MKTLKPLFLSLAGVTLVAVAIPLRRMFSTIKRRTEVTYEQIPAEYRRRYGRTVKACWIADVKRNLSKMTLVAPNLRREKNFMDKFRLTTLAVCVGMVVSGCAPPPWQAKSYTDDFSDASVCRVASAQGFKSGFQEGLLLYTGKVITHELFAEMRSDGPRIGVWGRFGVVAGDVQMRVDKNPTVNITAQDTPIDYAPTTPQITPVKIPNVTEEQQKSYEESLKQASQATTQSILATSSPYKVATGAKARVLLNQIESGKRIKFRVLGINQATTTTAEIEITDQFKDALQECGLI